MNRTCCTCRALPANPPQEDAAAVAGEADTRVVAAEAPPLPAIVERDDTAVTAGEQAPTPAPADRRDRPATRRERRLTLMAAVRF